MPKNRTIVFSPFSRIEGNLNLRVEVSDGRVASARASGTLFRGFEQLVRGREPMDAIVFLCRICGQCSAVHSAAASAALADAYGVRPPDNALFARSVIQAVEVLLSHIVHFYFSLAPDMCALPAAVKVADKFHPKKSGSLQEALQARHFLLGLLGLFAGKWPNTLAMHPGGVTRPVDRAELIRARGILAEFVRFAEENLLGCESGKWLANRSMADVEKWLGDGDCAESDMGLFISLALSAGLERIGRGPGRFLSAGGFALPDGRTWLDPGYSDGCVKPLDPGAIREDVTACWYESQTAAQEPGATNQAPAPDKEGAYSWGKAPRYDGKSAEVGPIARLLIGRDPLVTDVVRRFGSCVFTRVLSRLHEIILLAKDVGAWIDGIDPDQPFCVRHAPADSAEGFALTEAPRGMLGHWVKIEQSRIRNYQVVTPTGWNLSPRDDCDSPGPLEEALVGTPVGDGAGDVNLALVVGSFDPCLYCSVH